MRSSYLPFSPPCLSEAEIEAVVDVLKKGEWLSSGPKAKEFEDKFKKTVGAEEALALNSCTAGLHIALKVHGVGPGDEVITTPMTFCATANVIEHVGATTRLADIDPETLLIDPKEIEKTMTSKTKVILPVHYAGQPCEMPEINDLASNRKIKVVEDAAHCMPSKIGDRWIGSSGNLTLFSFYATKNITSGEGGMMTGPKDLLDKARVLALHGMTRSAWNRFEKGGQWKYDVEEPGFKYNLPDMAAALGLVQLQRLNELYERRLQLVRAYDEAFAGSKFLRTLKIRNGVQSSYHLYPLFLNLDALTIGRDQFIHELSERNIGASVHYTPIHMMSYYAKKYGWKPNSFPRAQQVFECMLSLPLSSKLTVNDANDVIEAVSDICKKFAR